MEKRGYVYMMASQPNGTLYVGVTSDIVRRVSDHREGALEGFTRRYGCKTLVWYEVHDRVDVAIQREKQLKNWSRAWKVRAIDASNPEWADLFPMLL